jgi:heptosyltransferase-2
MAAKQLLQSWTFVTDQQKISPFLCIGIGAMNIERQWGSQNFSELIKHLSQQRPNLKYLILGGPHEKVLADDIIAKLHESGIELPPVFLGRLDEAVALMSLSSGYVGNDTSLLNFMACVQKPAVGLYSQSRPLEYSPYLHKTDALRESEYGQAGIIRKITPSDVLEKINMLWPSL